MVRNHAVVGAGAVIAPGIVPPKPKAKVGANARRVAGANAPQAQVAGANAPPNEVANVAVEVDVVVGGNVLQAAVVNSANGAVLLLAMISSIRIKFQ